MQTQTSILGGERPKPCLRSVVQKVAVMSIIAATLSACDGLDLPAGCANTCEFTNNYGGNP